MKTSIKLNKKNKPSCNRSDVLEIQTSSNFFLLYLFCEAIVEMEQLTEFTKQSSVTFKLYKKFLRNTLILCPSCYCWVCNHFYLTPD